jgi:hypothetical protein
VLIRIGESSVTLMTDLELMCWHAASFQKLFTTERTKAACIAFQPFPVQTKEAAN